MYPGQLAPGECTALAALPEATAQAKCSWTNWTGSLIYLESTVLLQIEGEENRKVVTGHRGGGHPWAKIG